jgi:hypothetical protein
MKQSSEMWFTFLFYNQKQMKQTNKLNRNRKKIFNILKKTKIGAPAFDLVQYFLHGINL